MNTSSAQSCIRARHQAERRARFSLLELLCTVSILRTALTRVLPLAGSATWWVTLAALVPGAALFLLGQLLLRHARAATLTELVRQRLGRPGVFAVCAVLAALLLLDAAATLTALVTFFSEGVGTRGTPLTLSLLTAAALLPCLHRDGLPRAVHLLRWVLLAAAIIAGAALLPECRVDHLHPSNGTGLPSVWAALRTGFSIGWPLAMLLTIPADEGKVQTASLARVTLGVLTPLIIICLTAPQEILSAHGELSAALLLPGRYAPTGAKVLLHCLLLIVFFFALGGALHGASELAGAPLSRPLTWLPHIALALLTLTQLSGHKALWRALEAVNAWALLPLAVLFLLLTIPARRRRP